MGKNVIIGGRIHNPEVGNVALGANEVLDDTKGKKQNVINTETDAELLRLENEKQDNLSFDNTPTENSTNPITSGGVYASELLIHQAIEMILALIPSAASALNQLADKSFVNSTVATATATFRGTYNVVTDLGLEFDATHEQIAAALLSHIATADNNDYAFVQIPVSATSTDIRVTERYKFNGTAWAYEYDLNNSGFTALQWAAINSGITALLVSKLGSLPTAEELALAFAGKQATLTFDNVPVSGSNNPVKSGGLYELFTAVNAKFPANASADNKLVAEDRLAAYVAAIIGALDASYNVTSSDGHVTVKVTQVDGAITSVEVLTSDIASEAALTTLTGRVSTNEQDIADLQELYQALSQTAVEPMTAADWATLSADTSNLQERVIYRVAGTTSYTDYMWNGTSIVLMATYNNAIDDVPSPTSQNLVKSSGIWTEEMKDNAFLIPTVNGDITGLLHFLNGVVISGSSTDIGYGTTTRLVSGKINNITDFTLSCWCDSTLKLMVLQHLKTDGKYYGIVWWTSDTTFSFSSKDYPDADNFVILAAKMTDGNISPSEIAEKVVFSNVATVLDISPKNNMPVSSEGVFNEEYVLQSSLFRVDDITKALKFINGVAVIGRQAVDYTINTRLVSFPINCQQYTKITIRNNNSSLKFGIIYKDKTTGIFTAVSSAWETVSEYVFDIDNYKNVAQYFLINIAKTDDSAISVSDFNNLFVLARYDTASDELNGYNRIDLQSLPRLNGYIENGYWKNVNSNNRTHVYLPVSSAQNKLYLRVGAGNVQYASFFAYFLSSYNVVEDGDAGVLGALYYSDFVNGIFNGEIPAGTNYIYIQSTSGDRNYTPSSLIIYYDSDNPSDILSLNPEKAVLPKFINSNRKFVPYGGENVGNYPDCLTIVHFSDIHADNNNILRIKKFCDKYQSKINDVIQTGDYIGGSWSDGMPAAASSFPKVMSVLGNHDAMNREGTPPDHHWVLVNQKDCYDVVFAPFISQWNVTQPSSAEENGYCYYYKDYANSKVRFIALDCMHWDETENTWLTNVLADAITNSYHVLIGVHYPPFNAVKNVQNPFDSVEFDMTVAGTGSGQMKETVKDFIDNGGNFICWICGHIHDDVMGVCNTEGYGNQLAISIACASVAPSYAYSTMARENGTITQDCFNILSVDTYKKIIKITRIGANYDRYMRRKNTLSWDYGTGELMYVD